MRKVEEIVRAGLSRVETIKVRTALNPLLWLVGLTWPAGVVALMFANDRVLQLTILFVFGAVPIAATIAAYFMFLMRDPERLQSEEYRIQQRALQMLYRKGRNADIVDVVNQVPHIRSSRDRIDSGSRL